MLAILRASLLGLALAACATTPPAAPKTAALDRHGATCSLDVDCPTGSCRSGRCSWTLPDPPLHSCQFDEQCYAGTGSCLAGQCLPGPAERTFLGSRRGR